MRSGWVGVGNVAAGGPSGLAAIGAERLLESFIQENI